MIIDIPDLQSAMTKGSLTMTDAAWLIDYIERAANGESPEFVQLVEDLTRYMQREVTYEDYSKMPK